MIEPTLEKIKNRNRQRSIAISDNLIKEVKELTRDCISVSGFIRMAIINELERCEKNVVITMKNEIRTDKSY